MKKITIVLLFLSVLTGRPFFAAAQSQAPVLRPGFDIREYTEMLKVTASVTDSSVGKHFLPDPDEYVRVYRSPVTGLKNRWDMWYRKDHQVAVISIRGTTADLPSWLENFYAAMVPAHGSLQLNDSLNFTYRLATDDKAMVHVGWLVGLGYMASGMVEKVREAVQQGIRSFIITGHSQGGALSYLTRSYFYYLVQAGELPAGLTFKTYCSAAPKPGNLFYAYDFDFITRNGWGFNVVNAADWVPETPITVQTLTDLNPINPFIHLDQALKKMPWLGRIYIKHKYNRLNRFTRKAQREFRKTLGDLVYKQVKKTLPQLRKPGYAEGVNYQRAGIPIVLLPDSAYYRQFPELPGKIFQHHMFAPYLWLAQKYYAPEKP